MGYVRGATVDKNSVPCAKLDMTSKGSTRERSFSSSISAVLLSVVIEFCIVVSTLRNYLLPL